MKIRKLHKIQIGAPDSVSILLSGCGGTGSFTALNLARLAASNPQIKFRLWFIDPDHVEEKNIGRQYFCPADVGQPKAATLATRLNLAFGLQITPIIGRFEARLIDACEPAWSPGSQLTLIIGCVDTPTARAEIDAAIRANIDQRGYPGRALWWLDAGNDRWNGQVLLGNSADDRPIFSEFGDCVALPLPSVQEPELVEARPAAAAVDLSCADLVALNVQARTVNYMAASWLDVFVERLLISHDLNIAGVYFNQKTGSARSVPITEGVIRKDSPPGAFVTNGDDEGDYCPDCGTILIYGEDEEADTMIDVVFCPACGWRMPLDEYNDDLAPIRDVG